MIKKAILSMVILLAAMAFGSTSSWAQEQNGRVVGSVISEQGDPLEYASVFLIKNPETQEVSDHTTSSDKGKFALTAPVGKYILGVSYVGYEMHISPIDLTAETTLDLGVITLQATTKELQAVVVQGKAIKVRSQPDGFSVDVSDLRKSSNDALDLLSLLPTIKVKGTDLSVIGKKNVVIQVGNVLQRVRTSEIGAVLKGYDAELIQRVEILMQPPLRYDPDGNTAMIILHTSSVFKEYMGGIVGSELMKGEKKNDRYGAYASLMYNRKKLFWSIAPSYNHSTSYMSEDVRYTYSDRTYQMTTPSEGKSDYMGGRATLQYQYSPQGHVGIAASIAQRKMDNLFDRRERNTPTSALSLDANSLNNYKSEKPKIETTAYWESTIGRKDNKMWLELSYYNFTDNSDNDYQGRRLLDSKKFFTYLDKDRLNVSGWGFNNDYSVALDSDSKSKIDAGVKALGSTTVNKRSREQWMLDNAAETFDQTNEIKLQEMWLTPYLSGTVHLSSAWWMRIGLRTSITARKLTSDGHPDPYRYSTSWLPSLHMTYSPNRVHKLFFTLNSSAKQPNFGQLTPFEWRVSQISYLRGNTALSPERNYQYDLGYTYQGVLSISAAIKQDRGLITPVTTMHSDKIYTQPENAQNKIFKGISADYYFDKLKWMSFSINAYYGHSTYTSQHPQLDKKVTSREWGAEGYTSLILNSNRTLTAYLSGSYTGRTKTAVSILDPRYEFGAGMSYFMLKRRLAISLSGINLFASRHKGYSQRKGYMISFDNRYNYPTLYFSISYKFSNAKDQSPRKQMSARDIDRRL